MTTSAERGRGWGHRSHPRPGRLALCWTVIVALGALSTTACTVGSAELTDAGQVDGVGTVATFQPPGGKGGSGALQVLGGALAPGAPAVQRLEHDGIRFTLTVTPSRPGWNLARVDTRRLDPQEAGADHHEHATSSQRLLVGADPERLVPATSRTGTDGAWARVWLPQGESFVHVSHGPEHLLPFPVTTGGAATSRSAVGPDGPECQAAAVGRLLAGESAPVELCPSDHLRPQDAASLRAVVATLAERGAKELTLIAGSSRRGSEAAKVVAQAARADGLRITGSGVRPDTESALLVVSGWSDAARTLRRTASHQQRGAVHNHGTWLAPWLLTPSVVDEASGAVLPLDFDIRDAPASAYAAALARTLPGTAPTQAGYVGWSGAWPDRTTGTAKLYAAARTAYMPASAGHALHETTVPWFPGGTVTAVSGPLTTP